MNAVPKIDADPIGKLSRARIGQPYEALFWLPRRYADYTRVVPSDAWHAHIGQKICAQLEITQAPQADPNHPRFTLTGRDAAGEHSVMVFGALRWSPWKSVKRGDTVRVLAQVGEYDGRAQLNSPELIPRKNWGRVVPVYRGLAGRVSSESVYSGVQAAFDVPMAIEDAVLSVRQNFDGMAEQAILDRVWEVCDLRDLFHAVHRPRSIDQAHWGMRLARKLAVAQVRHKAERASVRPFRIDSVIRVAEQDLAKRLERLPFRPTAGTRSQMSAIAEIVRLLAEPHPMDAVLSADVGVGKTLCYSIVAAAVASQGKKVAVLIPNGLLVEQVASEFASMFPETPVARITEDTRKAAIPWEKNPILIGTTALIGVARKAGWSPDLLIVDEQQKTSLAQREELRAAHTNCLECTATALPRTVALITHGGKQLIQVAKRHAVQKVHTRVVDPAHKREMMARIYAVLAAGGQVALIYPRVDGQSEGDRKSVTEAGGLWEKKHPGRVAVLHGRLKPEEKTRIMTSVKSGEKSILVSSSIIEIGVTISNLKLLVVVHADRFGASTLHQMRGRLVRHGGEGWCYLYLPEEVEEETTKRLRLLEKTNDGFQLAEWNMELRGFGDLADDSEAQAGASLTLFRGLRLMPRDFA